MMRSAKRPDLGPGTIIAGIAGVALAIGAPLTWATASLDIEKIASALGINPSLLQGAAAPETSRSLKGLEAGARGVVSLIAGIVIIISVIVIVRAPSLRRATAVVILVAGLVGAGAALYDLGRVRNLKDDVLAEAGPGLESAGFQTSLFADAFSVSAGVGIWICAGAGLMAAVGGVIVLAEGSKQIGDGAPPPPILDAPVPPVIDPSPTAPPMPHPVDPPADPGTATDDPR